MSNYGRCKYCGKDLSIEVYKRGKCKGSRIIIYCSNENCSVKPCTDENIPSIVLEEVKYFSK